MVQVPQADLRTLDRRMLGPKEEQQGGGIFKIRLVLFLKSGGLELPRDGEPLDSSETARDL